MTKISGHYLDHDKFSYTVFYDRSKKKYVMIISNPEGKFCSSSEYTKKQIVNQIGRMTRLKDQ